jgi:YaiO family outer membrane protein
MKRAVLIFCLLAWGGFCVASTSTVDTERLSFTEARALAKEGDRAGARALCLAILEQSPDRHEVRIYLGRLYAWDKRYPEARSELEKVLTDRPGHLDASLALADVERWSDRPAEMLEVVAAALEAHPEEAELWLQRARALSKLDRVQDAFEAASRAESLDPELDQATVLRRELELKALKNKFRADFLYDDFDDGTDSWKQLALALDHRFRWGTGIARLNLADRFNRNGAQIEFDAYPKLPAIRSYLYLNAGFSGSRLYPDLRGGAELFHNFGGGWEGSFGLRHLRFDSSNVTLWTGSVGKYFGNNFVWVRPFWSDKVEGTSTSGTVAWRHYHGGARSYTTLYVGFGSSPDDDLTTAEVNRLDSKRVLFEWQQRMRRVWILRLRAGWRNEEFITGDRKRLTYGVGFQRLF